MADLDGFIERLDYPVYVVTAAAAGEQAGCLVGFASQCSIDPVRFTVWLSKANRTLRVARAATHLAVHLLGREQLALAELFGGECG
ncbi:MAG TPA: flavin reductase, partial [Streptomyces sp.]|nr:flavin reductase [Streptomyces sp.]